MPINIPNPIQNVGSTDITDYPPIPYGTLNGAVIQQQGFGFITTLINPFFISFSYPVTSSVGSFLYYGTTTTTTSSVDVSDYNNHTFQAFVTASVGGTGSIYVSSSIDGLNFVGEFSFVSTSSVSSSLMRITGSSRRRYFVASYSGSKGSTGSLYLLSGQ
jgi:hypothetical protein